MHNADALRVCTIDEAQPEERGQLNQVQEEEEQSTSVPTSRRFFYSGVRGGRST